MKVVLAGGRAAGAAVESRSPPASGPPTRRRVASARTALGYPLFVKPARGGSSIGISKAHDASELDACLEEAHRHDPKALVEVSAEGAREVECGVLQALDGTPETSVPAEIRITGDHEFYDFAAKYLPEEATELDVPADLPDDVTARLQDAGGARVRGGRLRGPGAGRLLRDARRVRWWSTRSTRCPASRRRRCSRGCGRPPASTTPTLVDRLIQLALARDTGLR